MGIGTRLADLAGAAVLTAAEVVAVDRIDERFVLVELHSPAFGSATWAAGAKLQIRPRRGTLAMRTYTPVDWDTGQSRTRLLAYTHGDGPAADWFRAVEPGTTAELMGPRRSISPPANGERVVLVGDETSIALAVALQGTGARIATVFEAQRPDLVPAVLDHVGLKTDSVEVVASAGGQDRTALLDRVRAAVAGVAGPCHFGVEGEAATMSTAPRGGHKRGAQHPRVTR
ncbi:siderophore-interacting protein, partial [Lentzea sp. NPDC059081]|uniref:siderophore-interacting protein n=1 Tax=Lentzea sp. NPDC059081 TaxID=3346719 RepID=UPI00368BB949